ncbi:hypothetical protein P3T27_002734 [Kitasatospora sp. MAA19]|uniref:hypothetical protein n=1 Tax=unclassified Kitasatospora TaxID=2633591 RepID=UPI00247463A4|nr:hypothetical protein [Kitasatospora sp. MAA19]MDH6706011.1 hypothetical protein [Kitasatospora sp. MAA19]
MDKRNALRAGAVSATVTLMMLLSSPAMAVTRDDGDDPGAGLSVGQTIGLYVLIPIAAFVIIAALAGLPYGKGKKK